ncbi:hypothetical protein VPH35_078206 [Triticum aestivum]
MLVHLLHGLDILPSGISGKMIITLDTTTDAEHPSIIPMDSTPMHQAPRGPMTRARACAIETEVNSLLLEIDMEMNGTWLLPHRNMLCVIRYEDELRQEVKEYPQGLREGPQDPRADRKCQDEEKEACKNCTTGQSGPHIRQSGRTEIALPDSPVAPENASVLTALSGPYHRTVW